MADPSAQSKPATSSDEPGSLNVAVRISGVTAFVRISGELDMGTESRLSEGLDPYTGQYAAVVYELGGLSFIDVIGLRSLDNTPDTIASVTVRDPSRQVRRLLDLAGRQSMIDTAAPTTRTEGVMGEVS